MNLQTTLNHAVTRFDRKQQDKAQRSKRHHYNAYALGIYLQRVDDIVAEVENGSTVEDAIQRNFNSELKTFVLKFMAEHTVEGEQC